METMNGFLYRLKMSRNLIHKCRKIGQEFLSTLSILVHCQPKNLCCIPQKSKKLQNRPLLCHEKYFMHRACPPPCVGGPKNASDCNRSTYVYCVLYLMAMRMTMTMMMMVVINRTLLLQ